MNLLWAFLSTTEGELALSAGCHTLLAYVYPYFDRNTARRLALLSMSLLTLLEADMKEAVELLPHCDRSAPNWLPPPTWLAPPWESMPELIRLAIESRF
jgi:hypothetical protein